MQIHIYHRVHFDIENKLFGVIVNLFTESFIPNDDESRSYRVTYYHRYYDEKEYKYLKAFSKNELKCCKEIVEKIILTDEQLHFLLTLEKNNLNELTYEDFKKIGYIKYIRK